MLKTGKNSLHPNCGLIQKLLALVTFSTAMGFKTRNGKTNLPCDVPKVNFTTQNIQGFEIIQEALRLVLRNQTMQFTGAHLLSGA